MPIHVDCPVCGQRLRVPNFAAGRITKCSACGNAVRVRQPKELLEEDSGEAAAAKPSKRQAEPFSLSEVWPRSVERLSGWLDSLADRPARILVVALIFVAGYVGVATAKWALSKSIEAPTSSIVEPVDPEPWDGVGTSDANDSVRVTLVSANPEQVVIVPFDSKLARKTPKAYLRVVLKIENLGPSEIKYSGWPAGKDNKQVATLRDDSGSAYDQAVWDARVVGQVGATSIRSGGSVEEVLVFGPPATYARYLKLALPAEACGGTGLLRIKIPHTRVVD
jgi:hypothetical protein